MHTDEESFGKLSDDDAIILCLLLALEVVFMGLLFTFKVDDKLFTLVENLEAWNSFPQEKAHKRRNTSFMVSSIGGMTDNSVRKKWLNDLMIIELNFRVFNLETIIKVLANERNDRQAKLQFNDEFSSMTSDLCDSLNSIFVGLIQQHDSDEDISQDYIQKDELRLCLEDEERLHCEHEKLIVQENRFRLEEANMLRLEEDNMLQLAEQMRKSKMNL
nr:phospholipase-like protein [Tanacetum cinerariifolium]